MLYVMTMKWAFGTFLLEKFDTFLRKSPLNKKKMSLIWQIRKITLFYQYCHYQWQSVDSDSVKEWQQFAFIWVICSQCFIATINAESKIDVKKFASFINNTLARCTRTIKNYKSQSLNKKTMLMVLFRAFKCLSTFFVFMISLQSVTWPRSQCV